MKAQIPAGEIAPRIASLQEGMARMTPPLDAAVIVQNADLYYLAGTIQTSHLVVPREGTPRLLVRKVIERARDDSPLEDIRPMRSLKALAGEIRELCGPPPWRIGMELDVLPAMQAKMYRERLGDGVELTDVSGEVLAVRAVKSAWEIDRIREAARINDRLHDELPDIFEAGMSTFHLQARLTCRACELGHVGLIRMRGFNVETFVGIVVSGPTGAVPGHSQFPIGGTGPHRYIAHGGDREVIRPNVPIIFDSLGNASGYHHDQTRMAVIGEMPMEAARIDAAMREVLRRLESLVRPGVAPSAIYEAALECVSGQGLGEGFLGVPGYAVRFVGHAVGLEVNETPVLARGFDAPLVEGNVLAIEPKFSHPEYGVIGVENTYVVRENGAENLGQSAEDVIIL